MLVWQLKFGGSAAEDLGPGAPVFPRLGPDAPVLPRQAKPPGAWGPR